MAISLVMTFTLSRQVWALFCTACSICVVYRRRHRRIIKKSLKQLIAILNDLWKSRDSDPRLFWEVGDLIVHEWFRTAILAKFLSYFFATARLGYAHATNKMLKRVFIDTHANYCLYFMRWCDRNDYLSFTYRYA